jgi:uncharacterized integral membrane protein
MGAYIKGVVIVIVLLFLVTFGVKNSQLVQLNYYFGIAQVQIPLYGLVYISLLVGIFVGMGVGLFKRIQLGRQMKKLKRERDQQQRKEVEAQLQETEKASLQASEEKQATA